MTVFISYRHTDRAQAMTINNRLTREGISTYLDVLDVESQSTDDITSVITRRIRESTHLIAVVSSQTAQSWWVPFEIGEATITNRRICSYRTTVSELPEYLSKWPQMTKPVEIELFIQSYKNEISGKRQITLESFNGSEAMRHVDKMNADKFHADLKQKIWRGY
ncbi:toll/interleukin-1 receptor domain-containing protein [Salmonella enterica]|uniref:Toll/interleukin-1 receptor domain-containing protein n=1 Tax=Salmonella enterica subsp. salamae serovar 42:f,g,t:-- TaxID=41518 RepID=A0A737LPC0_SALER|nr:toll/interleukin-1 receptor domain-containing protein [Salmonella enterica]EBE1549934.1 toll/interleukin-1 receptor domain-containing protein [Salmonella enterica subsp. enterica]ECJ2262823.1 toll/interleukin-1 receptor domain-containing protein [Salmonella enterica subsp. salamae]HCM1994246.1 toll/interleukin-1 receptor domain-containing protein [Salmonella enterica subsp. salamae serovar 53:z4,z24:-]EBN8527949.1 toll/interleukin-1 receptor domain-containing protein [Salmonella enterica]EB